MCLVNLSSLSMFKSRIQKTQWEVVCRRKNLSFIFALSEKINSTFHQATGHAPSYVLMENKKNLREGSTFSGNSNIIVDKEFHKQQNCFYQGYMKRLNMQEVKELCTH